MCVTRVRYDKCGMKGPISDLSEDTFEVVVGDQTVQTCLNIKAKSIRRYSIPRHLVSVGRDSRLSSNVKFGIFHSCLTSSQYSD
ncbi:hypothetical protein WN55_08865 [Dufourea novaeangliae]|uniref:Uncharacterized protein n=1 Tax=Dufourea novaeangliae TaxID=178035 RepID=A0A154P207_DUFNO|nr:hypothetical protein WN55_08865 [Dufourea novaeangliae]